MYCDIPWKHLKYAIYGIILGNWFKSIFHIGASIIQGANPLLYIPGIVNGGHIPTADISRDTYAELGGILCL
jgi:hypothetical protein